MLKDYQGPKYPNIASENLALAATTELCIRRASLPISKHVMEVTKCGKSSQPKTPLNHCSPLHLFRFLDISFSVFGFFLPPAYEQSPVQTQKSQPRPSNEYQCSPEKIIIRLQHLDRKLSEMCLICSVLQPKPNERSKDSPQSLCSKVKCSI